MVRKHKRMGFLRPKQELEKLRPARAMLVAICTEYPIHSDACRRASEAMKAIDAVADALVGDPQFFGTSTSCMVAGNIYVFSP